MYDTTAWLCGELERWPSKDEMAAILRNAGLPVFVGRQSIRIANCTHFVFNEYAKELGNPCIDADADSPHEMMADAKPVSDALAAAGIRHRFEIYDCHDRLIGYFDYCWQQSEDVDRHRAAAA